MKRESRAPFSFISEREFFVDTTGQTYFKMYEEYEDAVEFGDYVRGKKEYENANFFVTDPRDKVIAYYDYKKSLTKEQEEMTFTLMKQDIEHSLSSSHKNLEYSRKPLRRLFYAKSREDFLINSYHLAGRAREDYIFVKEILQDKGNDTTVLLFGEVAPRIRSALERAAISLEFPNRHHKVIRFREKLEESRRKGDKEKEREIKEKMDRYVAQGDLLDKEGFF